MFAGVCILPGAVVAHACYTNTMNTAQCEGATLLCLGQAGPVIYRYTRDVSTAWDVRCSVHVINSLVHWVSGALHTSLNTPASRLQLAIRLRLK